MWKINMVRLFEGAEFAISRPQAAYRAARLRRPALLHAKAPQTPPTFNNFRS